MQLLEGHSARVISIQMPIIPEVSTPQELLAYCARVSNTANQGNHKTGARLIRRLIERREWSPLEQVAVGVEIVTTRDISRQILRHDLKPQEFSQRYAEVNPLSFVLRECRFQHPTDRQKSIELDPSNELHVRIAAWWEDSQRRVWNIVAKEYSKALENEIAKECARAILPEGNTPTLCYFNGYLRNWYHYTQVRCEPETQKEHRQIANQAWDGILEYFKDLPDHRHSLLGMPTIKSTETRL